MKRFALFALLFVSILVVSLLAAPTAFSDQDLEREALVALYQSTNGDSWTHHDGWLSDTIPQCDWYGVKCDGKGYVVELWLGGNQLSGSIPPELGDLSNLQWLKLSGNQLIGSIPPELGDLSNLRVLFLSGNQLSGTIPPELRGLHSLTYLSLEGNQLSGAIPPELGNLSELTHLGLTTNQLSGAIPPDLGNLSSLTHLNLSINQLSGAIPPELGDLTDLIELGLSINQLSGAIPPELGNLGNLRYLHLSSNQLSGVIPPELGNLTYLQFLWLDHNQLSGAIPPELGSLSELTNLYLGENQLSGSIPPELGKLNSLTYPFGLTYLNMGGNQLSGAIPPELGDLTGLQGLYLSSNQLSGAIPSELGNLGNLRGLNLSSNQLSGTIPPELGDLRGLTTLDLGGNQLSGSIPPELGDLSGEWFSHLSLSDNQLSGAIPPELGSLRELTSLDLGGNQLSGSIPPELGDPIYLQSLDLSDNQLSGAIPPELGDLSDEWFSYLYLSSNQLSCWGNQAVLDWALTVPYHAWDYPNPGEVVCPCRSLPGNILQNTCFEEGEAPWQFTSNGWGGFETTTPAYDGSFAARVEIGSAASNAQLYQYNLLLEPNQQYRLYFAAKSNNGRDMSLYVHKHGSPYSSYGLNGETVDLSMEWQQYTVDFTTNSLATDDGRLRFWLAPYATAGTVYWFDNVYLLKVSDGIPQPPDPDPQDPDVPPFGHCSPPISGNVLGNPGFEESSISPWSFWTNGQGMVAQDPDSYECENGAKVTIWQEGSNVQLFQTGLTLQPNSSYQLRLAAKSSDGRDVRLYLHKHRSPYTNYGLNGLPLDLTDEWQVFVVKFTTTGFSLPVDDGRFRIWLAGSDAADAQYQFDDVVMIPLDGSMSMTMVSESLSAVEGLLLEDKQMAGSMSMTTTSESVSAVESLLLPGKETAFSGMGKGQLLAEGFYIDDDDAGREKGAFLPPQQRGAAHCDKAQPSHTMLWPADGRLVKVKIVGVGKPVDLAVNGIWQDEARGSEADGVIDGEQVLLRAERAEDGDGRVYHVAFSANYRDGKSCEHEVLVTVPLNTGTAGGGHDDGPLAKSTLP